MIEVKRAAICALAVVIAAAVSGCAKPADETAAADAKETASGAAAASAASGAVIARFGGETFTESELRDEVGRLNRRSREALKDADRLRQFIENHVLARLIYGEGEKRGFANDPDVDRQVADLKRRLVIQKVMQEHQSSPVTDEEVKAYYDANPQEFTTDRVKASHILIKEEALAKEIQAKLKEDPSKFEELAKEHSIDRSNSSKGGDLGFFGRGRMVKEFEDTAFALGSDGEISDLVETRFGFHIIKRTGREDGSPKPFDEVKNQIRIRMINDKRRTQTEQFLDQLKKSANLTIDDQTLGKFDVMEGAESAEPEDSEPPSGH